MKYSQQLDYRKRQRFIFRAWFFLLIFLLMAAGIAAYGYYTVMNQQEANNESTSTSPRTSAYYAPRVKVLRTPFFQFQTDQTWGEVSAESDAGKYVYRSFRNKLVEHELTVYVNGTPAVLAANRVLPVNLKGKAGLTPVTVSDHCGKAAGAAKIDNPLIVLGRVSFKCDSDSTNYTVLAGQVNGTSTLSLMRTDNTSATYALSYSNLKATPDSSQFTGILDSFQTR